MDRKPVESKMFKAVAYDAETRTLEVEFHNGGVYQYLDFTPDDWRELASAESKGSHFAQNVRGKFTHKKIEPEPPAEVKTSG